MFPINIETIITQYVALLFSDTFIEKELKRDINRTYFNLEFTLNKLWYCSYWTRSTFIGAFELFASNPDSADPMANLNRSCNSHTRIGQRVSSSVSHGDTLLSLVIMITVCRLLLQ